MKTKLLIPGVVILGLVIATHGFLSGELLTPQDTPDSGTTARGADRDDILLARGILDCANYVDVRSPLQAKILRLRPEGVVKKGELLVELDSSASEQRVNQQRVRREQAVARVAQAKRNRELAEREFQAELQAREGQFEIAKLALARYLGKNGEHEFELQNAASEIEIAEKRLSITETQFARLKQQRGTFTATDVEKAELAVLEARFGLQRARAARRLLRTHVHAFRQAELELQVKNGSSGLARLKLERDRALARGTADLAAAEASLQVETAKLRRAEEELKSCRIYAPQDGPMVHANVRTGRVAAHLEPGVLVRERQTLIRFPDYSQLQLTVRVPDSQIERVRVGQSVSVKIDAFPKRTATGEVTHISREAAARSRINRGVQEFAVVVSIREAVPGAKPGLTGVAEIDVSQ